jgi:predicted O-methyltransferase YrrM
VFFLILKKPSLVNLIIDCDLNFKDELIKRYHLPNGLKKINFKEFLKEENTLDSFSFLEGGSIVTDYLLLSALTKKLNKPTCFEIGTWRGESALAMAKHANKVVTLNLSKQELTNFGLSKEYVELQGYLCNKANNIEQLWGNTFNYDFTNHHRCYDLIFVDGDHKYKSVINDTKIAEKLMKNKKSVIVWHDYGFGAETIRYEVLLGILKGLPKDMHKHLYSVNNTLCAIYYPFNVDANELPYPQRPDQLFTVKINEKI